MTSSFSLTVIRIPFIVLDVEVVMVSFGELRFRINVFLKKETILFYLFAQKTSRSAPRFEGLKYIWIYLSLVSSSYSLACNRFSVDSVGTDRTASLRLNVLRCFSTSEATSSFPSLDHHNEGEIVSPPCSGYFPF